METITGKQATWPIMHTFYSELRSESFTIAAENVVNARMNLEACNLGNLTYIQSKDGDGEFVYEF